MLTEIPLGQVDALLLQRMDGPTILVERERSAMPGRRCEWPCVNAALQMLSWVGQEGEFVTDAT